MKTTVNENRFRTEYGDELFAEYQDILETEDPVRALAFAIGLAEFVHNVFRQPTLSSPDRSTIFQKVWNIPGLVHGNLDNFLSPQRIMFRNINANGISKILENAFDGMTGSNQARAKSIKHLPYLIERLMPFARQALKSEILFDLPTGPISERNENYDLPYRNALAYSQVHNRLVSAFLRASKRDVETAKREMSAFALQHLNDNARSVLFQIIVFQEEDKNFTREDIVEVLDSTSGKVQKGLKELKESGFLLRKDRSPIRCAEFVFEFNIPDNDADEEATSSQEALANVVSSENDEDIFNVSFETVDELFPNEDDEDTTLEDPSRKRFQKFKKSSSPSTGILSQNGAFHLAPQEEGLLKFAANNGWPLSVSVDEEGKLQFSFMF